VPEERGEFKRPLNEAGVWLTVSLDEDGQRIGAAIVTSNTAREIARALLAEADSVDRQNGVTYD
jgi:hypothetical protein